MKIHGRAIYESRSRVAVLILFFICENGVYNLCFFGQAGKNQKDWFIGPFFNELYNNLQLLLKSKEIYFIEISHIIWLIFAYFLLVDISLNRLPLKISSLLLLWNLKFKSKWPALYMVYQISSMVPRVRFYTDLIYFQQVLPVDFLVQCFFSKIESFDFRYRWRNYWIFH